MNSKYLGGESIKRNPSDSNFDMLSDNNNLASIRNIIPESKPVRKGS